MVKVREIYSSLLASAEDSVEVSKILAAMVQSTLFYFRIISDI